jgi:uncharacterized protein
VITRETIETLRKKYQTELITVWREYFQHVFLSYFYQQEHTDKVYFKGGTALRLLYKSPRFSEDLDFSSTLQEVSSIETAVINTLTEIAREGIQVDIKDAAPTTGGYLATLLFKNNGDTIPLRLEMSLRSGKKISEFTTVSNDFIAPYTIFQLNEQQLVGEKIAALLSRQKPRDFYDIYFLLRSNMIPAKNRELLQNVLNLTQKSAIRFDNELKRFLPKSHWMIIRDFKNVLEREIKRYL